MEDKALKEQMYSHIENWKSSGLTKAAYSRQLGIHPKKLNYWQKKYDKEQRVQNGEPELVYLKITS